MTSTNVREDMDSGAIMRRAHERGEQVQTYDPDRLVRDVAALLEGQGLSPGTPPGSGRPGMAAGAAGMLLRAFGILPAADWDVRDRPNAPDPDSR